MPQFFNTYLIKGIKNNNLKVVIRKEKIMKGNNELLGEIEELRSIKKAINDLKRSYLEIKEEDFKQNVKKIINWTDKIYEEIFNDYSKTKRFRMYGEFYIPTIRNLVDRYNVIKAKKVNSEDAIQIVNKIEGTIKNLDKHFEKVYNSFYENEILDLDAEIRVLLHELKK